MFGGLLEAIESIVAWITGAFNSIRHVFDGIDFTILYNWLPYDITIVITTVIATLIIIAFFKLIRSFIFFMG